MKLEWDEKYSIGNEVLDEQHKTWVEFYNRLADVMSNGSDDDLKQIKTEILQEMTNYVDYHFRTEEELMRKTGFAGAEKHWRLHKDFRGRIYEINRNYAEGSIVLNSEIMSMIKELLVDHILTHDMELKRYLQTLDSNPEK